MVYPQLHPGEHRFTVEAVGVPLLDPFGNPMEVDYDPVPTVYEWTIVDNAAPDTAIDFGPRESTSSTNAVFGVSSDDPTASLECSLDGATFSNCESPIDYSDLALGEHEFAVRSIDASGNTDASPASFAWEIVAPGPPNTPVGSNVTVTLPMPDGPGNGTVNFFTVSSGGTTAIEPLGGGVPLPPGYSAAGARYYDVATTADFGDPATLCLAYDPSSYSTTAVRLLALDGTVWLDITKLNNPFQGRVCGGDRGVRRLRRRLGARRRRARRLRALRA